MSLSGQFWVDDENLDYLTTLPLERLALSNAREVTETGFAHLTRLTQLEYLLIEGSRTTDAGLTALRGLPLTALSLTSCENITDEGLEPLATLPLTKLALENMGQISGSGFSHLTSLSTLERLSVDSMPLSSPHHFAHLQNLPLRRLHINDNFNGIVGDAVIPYLERHRLESLSLRGSYITAVALARLQTLPVQYLDLSECSRIAEGDFIHLTHWRDLRSLILDSNQLQFKLPKTLKSKVVWGDVKTPSICNFDE